MSRQNFDARKVSQYLLKKVESSATIANMYSQCSRLLSHGTSVHRLHQHFFSELPSHPDDNTRRPNVLFSQCYKNKNEIHSEPFFIPTSSVSGRITNDKVKNEPIYFIDYRLIYITHLYILQMFLFQTAIIKPAQGQ